MPDAPFLNLDVYSGGEARVKSGISNKAIALHLETVFFGWPPTQRLLGHLEGAVSEKNLEIRVWRQAISLGLQTWRSGSA
ncbi:hypothetical protein [Bathymodiolus japonicus methanotrophic gill symbiont]|uniref:hypothetical protein n=1 Tax=Bathymodiolus japonicus methanotrophic gill symbiont TaxID=113269 RepID=UPI001C8E2783|nr:hypothetical protein [Bathymodiolus japonicus methanotrophic gill symbiont]